MAGTSGGDALNGGWGVMELSEHERDLLGMALTWARCYVETGDPLLTAKDVEQRCRSGLKTVRPRALSIAQMQRIIELQALRDRLDQAPGAVSAASAALS